jgi:hypothetical protein
MPRAKSPGRGAQSQRLCDALQPQHAKSCVALSRKGLRLVRARLRQLCLLSRSFLRVCDGRQRGLEVLGCAIPGGTDLGHMGRLDSCRVAAQPLQLSRCSPEVANSFVALQTRGVPIRAEAANSGLSLLRASLRGSPLRRCDRQLRPQYVNLHLRSRQIRL